nr:serine-aspartate repeat-containing protein F-like [Procambarus clarkii]
MGDFNSKHTYFKDKLNNVNGKRFKKYVINNELTVHDTKVFGNEYVGDGGDIDQGSVDQGHKGVDSDEDEDVVSDNSSDKEDNLVTSNNTGSSNEDDDSEVSSDGSSNEDDDSGVSSDNKKTNTGIQISTHEDGGRLDYVISKNLGGASIECYLVNRLASDHNAIYTLYEIRP